jgi:hypothetical protein
MFVLPSTGFEPTPLLHFSTIRLALRPAPYIYIFFLIIDGLLSCVFHLIVYVD